MVMTRFFEKAGKGTPDVTLPGGTAAQSNGGLSTSFIIGEYEVELWLICLVAALIVLAVVAFAVLIRKAMAKPMVTRIDAAPVVPVQETAATPCRGEPQVNVAVHQHIGSREDQQDSYGVSDPNAYGRSGVMAIVADGMGGLANGRAVSSALVRTFQDGFHYARPGVD